MDYLYILTIALGWGTGDLPPKWYSTVTQGRGVCTSDATNTTKLQAHPLEWIDQHNWLDEGFSIFREGKAFECKQNQQHN